MQLPFLASPAFGQAFTFTLGNTAYRENFDVMAAATNYPAGWTGLRLEGSGTLGATLTPAVTNGAANSGGTYNVGTTAATDRALGSLASASTIPAFGASFLNNTGSIIGTLNFGGFSEQSRTGSNAVVETDAFEFSFDATSLNTGTWLALGSFNLMEVAASVDQNGPIDGNDAANRLAISGMANVNWAAGSTMWIRWRDANDVGNDAMLAIDDFTLNVGVLAGVKTIEWFATTADWNLTTPNWRDGAVQTTFASNDNVSFTDAGLSQSTVTVQAAGVLAGNMNVSNTTGTYTINGGPITVTGKVTKSNAGTLVLGAALQGSLVITGGTLRTSVDERLSDTLSVGLSGPGVLDIDGHLEKVGALNFDGGGTVQTGGGVLTLGGNITVTAAGGTPLITGFLDTGGVERTITIGDGSAAIDLRIDAKISGTTRLNFNGPGVVRLGADNTGYTSNFRLNAGAKVALADAKALGDAQLFFNGGALFSIKDLIKVEAILNAVSLGGDVQIGTNDATNFPTQLATEFAGPWTFFSTTPKTVSIFNTTTMSGGITGTGAGSAITKSGPGTLILASAVSVQSFSIASGTVEVKPPAMGDPALQGVPVILNPAAAATATLNLKVPVASFLSLASSGAGAASIALGDTAAAIDTELVIGAISDGATAASTYNGSITVVPGRIGKLTKSGPSTFTLAGTGSYSGPTLVNGGALLISGSLSGTGSVQVTGTGSTLGGVGTINLPATGKITVESGAALAPGGAAAGTGTLTVIGTELGGGDRTLTLLAGGQFVFELGSTTVGGSQLPANAGLNDQVALTGNLLVDGAILSGALKSGFQFAVNDIYFLVLNDGTDTVGGIFSGVIQGGTVSVSGPQGTASFAVSYTGNSGTGAFTGGNDIALQALTFTAIPEPGSLAMLGSAGAGLLGWRRRKSCRQG